MFDLLSVSLTVDKRREMKISGGIEEVELEKIASEIDASGKGFELGKEAEQEKDVTEAVLVLEQIQIEKKISLDQLKVELVVEKTGEIKLSDDAKGRESKKEVGEEKVVSMHETEIFVAIIPVQERKEKTMSKSR